LGTDAARKVGGDVSQCGAAYRPGLFIVYNKVELSWPRVRGGPADLRSSGWLGPH